MTTTVASVNNHFPDAENGFTTTLASTITSGATTVPLNSVAGYTNGQPAVFVVDPSDPVKKQTFTGLIDTTGIQVTSVVWTAGTNQTHTGGATVVDYATATHIAMMSKGILVGHTQAGAHAANSITTTAITDANVTTAKLAATSVTAPKVDFGGAGVGIWWEEIGRTTLGANADTITISSFGARKYLKVLISLIATGGTIGVGLRANNDTGNNYTYTRSVAGGAAVSGNTQPYAYLDVGGLFAVDYSIDLNIVNILNREKLIRGQVMDNGTGGVANAASIADYADKWVNTAAQITRLDVINVGGTGDFATGSEIIVLGHN